MEAENIAIAGIDARNRVASHELHFVSDGDARYGRSSDVVVRDQERIGDGAEHANLMADVGQIRACGWLDLTKDLETSGHPIYVTWIWTGCPTSPRLDGILHSELSHRFPGSRTVHGRHRSRKV